MIKNENEKYFKESPPSEGCPQDGVGKVQNILATIDSIPIIRKTKTFLPTDKNLRTRARALRKMGSLPEIIFIESYS